MPTIGYNYQIINPGYKADTQNTDLIAKVLMSKQTEFDQSYKSMQALQRQSLSINFLNKKEQGKIDSFNEEVNRVFSAGEFGDLSDPNQAQKYYAMFDRIGSDASLISKYRQDAQYQDQLRAVEEKRRSKDPAKAGFGAINYDNYMHRLREYSDIDLDSPDGKGYVLRDYTDYIDINKEVGELAKTIVPEKFTKQEVKNGYIVSTTYAGRDPEKVAAALREYMQTRGAAQIREEAEYTFRRAKNDPAFQELIFNDHVNYNLDQQREISDRLDKINEQLQSTKDPQDIAALAGQKAKLEDSLAQVTIDLKSPDEYFSRDAEEIINDMSKVSILDNMENFTKAHSGYSTSTKIDADRTYLEFQKMSQRVEEFNIEMQFKEKELAMKAQMAADELAAKNGTAAKTSTAAQAISSGASYISASDPTHINYPSTVGAVKESLTKLYAQQTNFLEQGLTHGDAPIPAERVGLEMLINPKYLDGNQYYADSPYLRAWKVAVDDLYKENPSLAEVVGKQPSSNGEWDKLKEANNVIKNRVNQMMTAPKNRTEAQFANALQDVNANKQSLEDFMSEANASGNPDEYIKNKEMIKIYSNAVYDFEIPEGADKDTKQRRVEIEQTFRPSFENYLDTPYSVYNPAVTSVSKETWEKQFIDPKKVRNIPYDQVRKVEVGPEGTLKVFFKPEAFQMVTNKDDEKDGPKSGALAEQGSYFMVKKGNTFVQVPRAEIEAKGYLEYNDPNFNSMNWYNQLGLSVSAKPQKRWEMTSDNQSVPFLIRKSTLTGNVEVSVMDGNWEDMKTSNVAAAINQTRAIIANATVAEIAQK